MTEDAKQIAAKSRNRILYVANPGSGSDSEDEDVNSTRPHPYANASACSSYQQYQPPQLVSPLSNSPKSSKASLSAHAPTPLTMNLPVDKNNHYQRSNPALSSPSSTSSPAIESTPPPSTPGVSHTPVDLAGDNIPRSEPKITSGHIFDKVKFRFPRSTPQSRRPATVRFAFIGTPALFDKDFLSHLP
jgi:hypothetical protein